MTFPVSPTNNQQYISPISLVGYIYKTDYPAWISQGIVSPSVFGYGVVTVLRRTGGPNITYLDTPGLIIGSNYTAAP